MPPNLWTAEMLTLNDECMPSKKFTYHIVISLAGVSLHLCCAIVIGTACLLHALDQSLQHCVADMTVTWGETVVGQQLRQRVTEEP